MRTTAIVLGVVAVLAVAGTIYLGWLNFDVTNGPESGNPKLEVTVDKEKAKDDLMAVKDKAVEIKDEVKEKVQELTGKKVSGRVETVAADALSVKAEDGQIVVVKLNAETKVSIAGRDSRLADVAVGETVTINYVEKDGEATARTVQVEVTK